jgi:hypothetical protein
VICHFCWVERGMSHPVKMYGDVNHDKNSHDLCASVCVTKRRLSCEWCQVFCSLEKGKIYVFGLTVLSEIQTAPTIYFHWKYRISYKVTAQTSSKNGATLSKIIYSILLFQFTVSSFELLIYIWLIYKIYQWLFVITR